MRPGLQRFKRIVDYREHGGAPLLGIRGVCIKSHGSSDSNAIKNAVRQTPHGTEKQSSPCDRVGNKQEVRWEHECGHHRHGQICAGKYIDESAFGTDGRYER